jgi:hypothetical protein
LLAGGHSAETVVKTSLTVYGEVRLPLLFGWMLGRNSDYVHESRVRVWVKEKFKVGGVKCFSKVLFRFSKIPSGLKAKF